MTGLFVNIHTHYPTPQQITPRTEGFHPWDAATVDAATLPPLPEGIEAVGEIGLDYASKVDREQQMELFRAQLAAARKQELPVVLHCVRAFENVMRELAACEPRAAIFHGFIGSDIEARRALKRGYYLSYGERTFRSPRTVEALRATPSEQLFLETDDSPVPIGEIYARAAEIRGESVESLMQATRTNYERIFGTRHG